MLYRKVIDFKLGSYQKNFWLFKAQHSGTKGICVCILKGLA